LYTQAIQKEPKNHVFFSNRSASYGGLELWDKAREDAKECIRLDPTFVKGYYRLATAQMALEDHDGALATIRQGLTIDPQNQQLTKQMRIAQQQKKVQHAKSQSSPPSSISGHHLDDATAQELQELQQQYGQTNRELQTVQANLLRIEREHRMTEITRQEMQDVPAASACYRSCGKMFLQSSQPALVQHLDQRLEAQTQSEEDMGKRLEYLQRKLQSERQNIEELVGNAGGGTLVSRSGSSNSAGQ